MFEPSAAVLCPAEAPQGEPKGSLSETDESSNTPMRRPLLQRILSKLPVPAWLGSYLQVSTANRPANTKEPVQPPQQAAHSVQVPPVVSVQALKRKDGRAIRLARMVLVACIFFGVAASRQFVEGGKTTIKTREVGCDV